MRYEYGACGQLPQEKPDFSILIFASYTLVVHEGWGLQAWKSELACSDASGNAGGLGGARSWSRCALAMLFVVSCLEYGLNVEYPE